jgi:uncharacterized protein YqcC (DUF446 family)
MKGQHNPLITQIALIRLAMQQAGVWSEDTPEWVYSFSEGPAPDIWQWLQFIYLPMRLEGSYYNTIYLAPQLQAYIENNPSFTPLLQLSIELDSLTPTFHP